MFKKLSEKEKEITINVQTLMNGVYWVELVSGDRKLHQEKLVILR